MSPNNQAAVRPITDEALSPKHHQVYLVLCQQIRDGAYSHDAPMPGELALAQQFGVSRITIRKALDRLEREGSIDRQRGRGTFVRPDFADSPVNASLSGSIENLIAMGLKTEVRVISFGYVPASAEVAEMLGIAPGATVQKAVRVRSLDGLPFSHLTTYVPEEIGRTYDAEALAVHPLLVLLERAGVNIRRAQQTITAKLAAPNVAELLEVEPGVALLCIGRVVRDDNDRAVEFITGLYRPDTYEHRMSIDRAQPKERAVWRD
jgi:GntR family transcriptional regulator